MTDEEANSLKQLLTLQLDVSERLSLLEASSKFADQQRQHLITTTSKINERLELIPVLDMRMGQVDKALEGLNTRVTVQDKALIEIGGMMKVVRWLWGGVAAILLALFAGIVQWYARRGS